MQTQARICRRTRPTPKRPLSPRRPNPRPLKPPQPPPRSCGRASPTTPTRRCPVARKHGGAPLSAVPGSPAASRRARAGCGHPRRSVGSCASRSPASDRSPRDSRSSRPSYVHATLPLLLFPRPRLPLEHDMFSCASGCPGACPPCATTCRGSRSAGGALAGGAPRRRGSSGQRLRLQLHPRHRRKGPTPTHGEGPGRASIRQAFAQRGVLGGVGPGRGVCGGAAL